MGVLPAHDRDVERLVACTYPADQWPTMCVWRRPPARNVYEPQALLTPECNVVQSF